MIQNTNGATRNTSKLVNPVSLGILYFSFSLSLWSSKPIIGSPIFVIAILCSLISLAFFIAVFSKRVLNKLNKFIVKPLVSLTFITFVYGFITGWVQAFSQVSGIVFPVILYFGFAWIIVILLILIRDSIKHSKQKKKWFLSLLQFIIPYGIMVALIINAGIMFYNHDFWSGGYLLGIAVLDLSVARGWLKLHGEVFE